MVRRAVDRFLVGLALLVLRGFFRSIEVDGRERLPTDRPLLVVANHYNGLVDPAILVHVFGRVPRFLATASLWRRRWVRPFLAVAGLLPVQRPQDQPVNADNRAMFQRSYQVLCRRRGLVAIFPEGITHDVPSLARIRTGAARLALGARASGARGVTIVPVGMTFDDKLALRSRALARVGEPIDLDADIDRFIGEGEAADDSNHAGVRRLTAEIERRLRAVSPDYRDLREAQVLSRAAEIVQRSVYGHRGVPLAEQDALAQRLAYAPAYARHQLIDALARYHLDLDLVGLRDHQVVPGYTPRQLLKGFFSTAARVALLAPFAVVGVLVHLAPYWILQTASRAVRRPVMKGTVRFLVALVVFPLTWALVVLLAGRPGALWTAVQLAALPVTGLLAVAFLERVERARRAWRGWQALRERRALLDDILVDRRRVVATVEAAAAQVASPAELRR